MRKVKSSHCLIQFPEVDLNTLKLQLFMDASLNSLPNGGSQIIFLRDSKNRTIKNEESCTFNYCS